MTIDIHAKSYDTYGGNPHLSHIGRFLLRGAPDFGEAVSEIDITLCLPDRGPPKKTLESTFERHHQHRSTLPKVTFYRKKRRIEIAIASDAMDGRDWKPTKCVSLSIFSRGLEDVIGGLKLIQKKVKQSDAFDLDALLSYCEAAKTQIPSTEDDLQFLIADLRAADEKRRAAMSPWDKLGIHWDDFHPEAKIILDDPFFWDGTNDFSPNGNDTGADLLEDYRDWLKTHKDGQPVQFMDRLAKQWGYKGSAEMDAEVREEADIALAYADVKLRGFCDSLACQLALDAIKNQRQKAEAATDWSHRQERLNALDRLAAKLVAITRK